MTEAVVGVCARGWVKAGMVGRERRRARRLEGVRERGVSRAEVPAVDLRRWRELLWRISRRLGRKPSWSLEEEEEEKEEVSSSASDSVSGSMSGTGGLGSCSGEGMFVLVRLVLIRGW